MNIYIPTDMNSLPLNMTEKEAYERGKQDGKQKKIQDAYDKGFKEGRGTYYSDIFFTTL